MKKLSVIFLALLVFSCGKNSEVETVYWGLISELSQNQQIRVQKLVQDGEIKIVED